MIFDAISSVECPELDADEDLERRMVEVFDNVIRMEEPEISPEYNLPLTTDTWASHHSLACSSPLTPSSSEHATDESSQRQLSPSFSFDFLDSFDPQIALQLTQLAIMAPNSTTGAILQGLNLVQSPSANPVSSDAQDLLSSVAYADLSQLDVWTNVAFASDEPFVPPSDLNSDDGDEKDGKRGDSAATALSLKKKRDFLAKNPPSVLRQLQPPQTALGGNTQEDSQQQHASGSNPAPAAPAPATTPLFPPTTPAAFDFGTFLAMSGNQISPDVMNLNQLLYTNPFGHGHSFHPYASAFQQPLAPLAPPVPQAAPPTTSTPTTANTQSPLEATNPPPAKKPRSRKSSTAVAGSHARSSSIAVSERRPNPESRSPSVADPHDHDSPIDDGSADSGRAMNPTEDKRRRNTAASARFRAKKKEREHAMESRCKDLESKVGELERECEALRRENGWLKGLVVGVTGGSGMPIAMPGGPGLPTIPPPQQATSSATTGSKRKRDSATEATA